MHRNLDSFHTEALTNNPSALSRCSQTDPPAHPHRGRAVVGEFRSHENNHVVTFPLVYKLLYFCMLNSTRERTASLHKRLPSPDRKDKTSYLFLPVPVTQVPINPPRIS